MDAVRLAASVFSREAVRTSRRWQTWALRLAFAALLFAIVASAWHQTIQPSADASIGATVGLGLFHGYVWTQMTLVSLLAPVLVGQAILEERDGATLELLALTRLTPAQILWGKVGSRLAVLGTLVLASTPLLAASMTFGGISPWHVVNAVVNSLVLLVVLGTIGGLFALVVDGVLGILLGVGVWSLAALFVLPSFYAVALASTSGDPPFGHLSPVFATSVDDATGLLPALAMACVLAAVVAWAEPLFAAAVVDRDDEDHGSRSPERARLAARVRQVGWAGLAVVFLAPLVYWSHVASEPIVVPGTVLWTARIALLWLSAVVVTVTGTGLLLMMFVRLAEMRHRLAVLRARVLASPQRDPAAMGRRAMPFRGRVWGHPVVWREVFTNAHGASSAIARWVFPIWFFASGLFGLAVLGLEGTGVLLAITGVLLGGAVTLALASEAVGDERRRRTLELISTSTMSGASFIGAKLTAVALFSWPYFGVALGVTFTSFVWEMIRYPYLWDELTDRVQTCPPGVPGGLLLKGAASGAWVALAWAVVTLMAMLAATWAPPRMAWVFNAAIVAGFLAAYTAAVEVLPTDLAAVLGPILFPLGTGRWSDPVCDTSPWLLASVLVYAAATAALFVASAVSIRLVVQRDAR